MRRLLVVALAALAVAPVAHAADPLVGRWRLGDGEVRVTFANGSYTGVVTESIRFAACTHRAGETMWRLWGGGGRYSGRHLSFGPRPGCGWRLWLRVSLALGDDDRLRIRVARREGLLPNACGLLTDCFSLQRRGARPPSPAEPRRAGAPEQPEPFEAWDAAVAGPPVDAEPLGEGYAGTAGSTRIVLARDGAAVAPEGSLLLAHTFADRTELTALAATRVLRRTATELRLAVEVATTDASGCSPGATGTLVLRTGRDEVAAAFCGRTLTWRDGARVTVRPVAGA